VKTERVMCRSFMGLDVRQYHISQLISANDLHKLGNQQRRIEDRPDKSLAIYFGLNNTKELIKELCIIDGLKLSEVKSVKKGRSGGTWVHPYLFIDMAMWYSPKLKIQVLKWVYDGLLQARENSGDSFKRMMGALTSCYKEEFENPIRYSQVSNLISAACKVGNSKDKWEKASEHQLKLRDKIQDNVHLLADVCANSGECLNKSISKAITAINSLTKAGR